MTTGLHRHFGGSVLDVRFQAAAGLVVSAGVLAVLTVSSGLGPAGWATGLILSAVIATAFAVARLREDARSRRPADPFTLMRGVLAADVAALVAASWDGALPGTATVTLASVALALDWVDGQVARRTRTTSALGAMFDQEIDAFLILVLSVAASREFGSWVLLIGAARYLMFIAGRLAPWLAVPVPPRYWGKVVAAVQGVTLTVALSGVLPRLVSYLAIAVALVLLLESFGRNIVWLAHRPEARDRAHRLSRRITTTLAFLVVWAALVAPDRLERLTPAWFLRIPVEGLIMVGVGLVLPRRPRQVVAWVAGVLLGLLTIVKVLDVGFYEELGRPFNPVLDWSNFGPALGVVQDVLGRVWSDVLLVAVLLVLLAAVVGVAVSVARVSAVTAQRRSESARGVGVLVLLWAILAWTGVQATPDAPLASSTTVGLAVAQVRDAEQAVRDQARFNDLLHSRDPQARVPTSRLLAKLRGKDVLIVFVESYGQVAVQDTSFSPGVDAVLRSSTAALSRAGWTSESAFVNSPTFGGLSWLAHSTLQSGLWVDNLGKYGELVDSTRFTLSDAFQRAGWHTVGDVPSDIGFWPQGKSFYHYDELFNRSDVGYRGPRFGYASMPDQYTLAQFQRNELGPGHRPVMAEIDLVSSHYPWAPLPSMVPWNQVGDGSIYDRQPAQSVSTIAAWRSMSTVRAMYGQSIQYSMTALTSWVLQLHDPNLVLVLLGDHQPSTSISGPGANHVAVMSIVARDPQVLADVRPWRWSPGLLPPKSATVWPMDAFRDRFLRTFDAAG
jgi:phosphatidylglycerophosphate synthase